MAGSIYVTMHCVAQSIKTLFDESLKKISGRAINEWMNEWMNEWQNCKLGLKIKNSKGIHSCSKYRC